MNGEHQKGIQFLCKNIRIHKPGNLHDPHIALYLHDEIRVLSPNSSLLLEIRVLSPNSSLLLEIRVLSPNSSLLLEIRILLKYAFYLRKIMLGFLQCTWRHHYTT
jgi:hypothetical protein